MWADYMRETYNRETLDFVGGFLTYEIQGKDLYIADIYVRPRHRRAGVGRAMFEAARGIALDEGCTRILGTVDVTRPGWRESIAAQEAVGFKLTSTNDRGQALLVYSLDDATRTG